MCDSSNMDYSKPLWQPSNARIEASNLDRFIRCCGQENFKALYNWSLDHPNEFWREIWKQCGVIASKQFDLVVDDPRKMPGAKWFSGSQLNFAENLLRKNDHSCALSFWGEDQVRRKITHFELKQKVAAFAQELKALGVVSGDRIAAVVPNAPESIIAMLASASIGAIWSSCSPDFGVSGILDRFEQISPKVLICSDGYFHKTKWIDICEKIDQVASKLPSLISIYVYPYGDQFRNQPTTAKSFNQAISSNHAVLDFTQLPFAHPLYIMFSSGTTGKPKCIVHSAGGTLIEHLKELMLHCDLQPHDRFFYQTTCGWMMWNYMVSGLACQAQLVLYDGSPLERDGSILWDMLDQEEISIFGTNAKYLALIEKQGIRPKITHKLENLKTILSTGSPLLAESFEYVYRDIKSDVMLASIAGGTDIIGCFALGSPLLPVYCNELQTRSLGMAVKVFNSSGEEVTNQKGELVCSNAFPSMPLGFWNDPEGKKYRAAYFEHFPGVWYHGDYVELTQHEGMIFYGRSDATLNPGGIRIGTAEIYRQVDSFDQIEESLAIGQDWHGDVRLILFVKMRPGMELDKKLEEQLCRQLRIEASPHHVPKKIIAVPDIPRTRSGKIVELAVRDVIHGRKVKNIEALANPESLDFFRNLQKILAI